MPIQPGQFSTRRVEIALAVLLAGVSLAPWWARQTDGGTSSAWTGPHFSWLPVLLCLAIVAGRSLLQPGPSDRWAAAGTVLALALAGWGWLVEFARDDGPPADASHQLVWVLEPQGSGAVPSVVPFDTAWGYSLGLCLMGLLLATFAVAATLRGRDRGQQD